MTPNTTGTIPDHFYCTCLRCGWRWLSDTVRMLLDAGMAAEAEVALQRAPPRRCAQCKSSYWQVAPIRNRPDPTKEVL